MNISALQFLIFIVVLILLELLAKDTNIIVVSWTLLWSIWVYIGNNEMPNGMQCDQQNQQKKLISMPAVTEPTVVTSQPL